MGAVIVGAVIAGLFGIAVVVVQSRLDRRNRDSEWQRRALQLERQLQREHDERVAELENELDEAHGKPPRHKALHSHSERSGHDDAQ